MFCVVCAFNSVAFLWGKKKKLLECHIYMGYIVKYNNKIFDP